MSILLLFFIGICAFMYYFYVEQRKNLPAGPLPIPFFGNILQFDPVNPQKSIADLSKKYGSVFTFWMGGTPYVFVTDFKLLKKTVIKQGHLFTGRGDNFLFQTYSRARNGKTLGIIFTDGKLWREQRTFSLHILRDLGLGKNLLEERLLSSVDYFVTHVKNELRNGGKAMGITFEEPLGLCIGSIISSVLIGHAFEDDKEQFFKLKSYVDAVNEIIVSFEGRLLMFQHWLRHVPLYGRLLKCNSKRVLEQFQEESWKEGFFRKLRLQQIQEVLRRISRLYV